MRKSFLIKILFLISFCVSTQVAQAQQWKLVMELLVSNDGRKMNGAEIKVFKDGQFVEKVNTDVKGAADVVLKDRGVYTVSISGRGMITKTIEINTNAVPQDATEPNYFPAEVDIFKKMDGLNYDILKEPIGKISYDTGKGEFSADRAYTAQRQKALQQLTDDYLRKKEEEQANLEKNQKLYDAAIKVADKAFSEERWEDAEAEYKKAAALMPIETYPSFQLAELETKLIKIRETNKKYDEAMAAAKAAETAKDYATAIGEYKRAASYKPDEELPKNKVKELQTQMANAAKVEQNYLAAIERGDNALKINDLNLAKTAFEEAQGFKPDETYPKNKLAEINSILNKKKAEEEAYNNAIAEADQALKEKKYEAAKAGYEKALKVRPTESYPQEQITKVQGLMAEAAKLEQNYLAAIEKGDNALAGKRLDEAKTAFQEASSLKPEAEYPKNKIKEIEQFIAENAAKDKAYNDKIAAADKAFGSKDYENAKTVYAEATKLKPTETYPSQKITEIDGILKDLAAKEAKYNEAIAAGDAALSSKDYAAAKSAYQSALSFKAEEKYPKDKLQEIETIVVGMQKIEEEYKAAIADGDAAFSNNDFEKARKAYQLAAEKKPTENYPQSQLAAIDQKIAALEELDKNYNDAINQADAALDGKDYDQAEAAYTKALSFKPSETYPQSQLAVIDAAREKLAAEKAAAEKLEADYKAAIASADLALAAKKYSDATAAYNQAKSLKPEETYPQEKIKEIEGILAQQAALEESYAEEIKKADNLLKEEKYEEAKTAYNNALAIKAEEAYPKSQIGIIEAKLKEIADAEAAAAKLQEDFTAALKEGETAFAANDFVKAKAAYNRALTLKPDATVPPTKLKEIEAKEAELAAAQAEKERLEQLEKDYAALIGKADAAFNAGQLEAARVDYQKALTLKSEEQYPQDQIQKINDQLADAAQQEEAYNKAISEADALMSSEDWEGAKAKYNTASSIKSAEQYPKQQIAKIDEKLAALAKEQEEIRLKQEAAAKLDADFNAAVAAADAAFSAKNYDEAEQAYTKALSFKPAETYPQSQLAAIDAARAAMDQAAKDKAAAEAAAALAAKYQAEIDAGDAAFEANSLDEAEAKYMAALKIKPEETYPQSQLGAIDEKRAALADAEKEKAAAAAAAAAKAKLDADYKTAVEKGDQAFAAQNWDAAEEAYLAALKLKPAETHPQTQLGLIDDKRAEIAAQQAAADKEAAEAARLAKIEQDYLAAIEQGDRALQSKNFSDAKQAFIKASGIKPNEAYPKNKLSEIAAIVAEKDAAYQTAISEGDAAMQSEDYAAAKASFQKALGMKPGEAYPQGKLTEIDNLLANAAAREAEKKRRAEEAARIEQEYNAAVEAGDQAFSAENYVAAKASFAKAGDLKPQAAYPKEKLQDIEGILQKQRDAEAAAMAAEQAAAAIEAQYQSLIASADASFDKGAYSGARSDYMAANKLKPEESYPKEQLTKIKDLLASQVAANKESQKKDDEPIRIQSGPKATITGDAEAEIDKIYREMWSKKNSDKNEALVENMQQYTDIEAENRNKQEERRKEASDKLNDISISMAATAAAASDVYMQNYEIVQEKEEAVADANEEWQRNSERQRNEWYDEESNFEKSMLEWNVERNQEIVDGKNEQVAEDLKEVLEYEKENASEQNERIQIAKQNNEETLSELIQFNKETAEKNLTKNTALIEEAEQNKKEFDQTETAEQIERIADAKMTAEDQLKEQLEFNKTKTKENLERTKDYPANAQSDYDSNQEQFNKTGNQIREANYQGIEETEKSISDFKQEKKDHFKENQRIIEENTEDLTEEQQRLENEAEKRRQENKDQEFYEGENLPRQDRLAEEYPQGVTEEIVENQNNSTTIRRIVVNGTQVDIFEKTLYSWGGIFYTKNGQNITKEDWDANSK